MTLDLERLKALEAKATKGPWRWGDWSCEFGELEDVYMFSRTTLEHLNEIDNDVRVVRNRNDKPEFILKIEDEIGAADWALIPAMRNALPDLIATIERYEAALRLAADRLTICEGRMRACNAEWNGRHELLDEVVEFVREAREALGDRK